MSTNLKIPSFSREKAGLYALILLSMAILAVNLPFFALKNQEAEADFEAPLEPARLLTLQSNCLLPVSNPLLPKGKTMVSDRINVVITAYSSTPWETDDTPTITAAGTSVRDGIVANNLLPFGTKIKIPEIYGDKIFVVEDRMHWRKEDYHIDIWFPSNGEAKNFGVKRTYVEVLKI